MNEEKKPAQTGKSGNAMNKPRPAGKISGRENRSYTSKTGFGGIKGKPNPTAKPWRGDTSQNKGEKRPGGARPTDKAGERKPYRPAGGSGRPYSPEKAPRRAAPARPVAKPEVEGLAPRRLALKVLRAVTENDAYASLALDEQLNACGLPLVDRRLAARLVYDTLEHLLTLDYALHQLMARPDTDIRLMNILRLGACQILLEDRIPESAACNTSVALCKEVGLEGLAGVCNGVLRNLIRQKEELTWPDSATEPEKALSIRHSVPEWLVRRLLADWGEAAEMQMAYAPGERYITVRPNLTRLTDEAFAAFLATKPWGSAPGLVPHAVRLRDMAEIAHDAGFVGGKFSIQGESSMMACLAVDPKPGMQILDACAAPGGKACLLAEMMNGTGRVQAWELHAHRVELIAAQARRLGLENVRPIMRDATKPRADLEGAMDAVLLDAPCTGLGVMAEKPDVKYRVSEDSVAELVALQAQLLDAVAPYVKKGGTLVYSTCSLLKDENERQAEAFLARHPEFEAVPLPDTIPERFRQYERTGLQLLPARDGVEGFYICRMRRRRV